MMLRWMTACILTLLVTDASANLRLKCVYQRSTVENDKAFKAPILLDIDLAARTLTIEEDVGTKFIKKITVSPTTISFVRGRIFYNSYFSLNRRTGTLTNKSITSKIYHKCGAA